MSQNEKKKISISIETYDGQGNSILSKEERSLISPEGKNPSALEYISIFFSVLTKQEFTKNETFEALHKFFVSTDKEKMPE